MWLQLSSKQLRRSFAFVIQQIRHFVTISLPVCLAVLIYNQVVPNIRGLLEFIYWLNPCILQMKAMGPGDCQKVFYNVNWLERNGVQNRTLLFLLPFQALFTTPSSFSPHVLKPMQYPSPLKELYSQRHLGAEVLLDLSLFAFPILHSLSRLRVQL